MSFQQTSSHRKHRKGHKSKRRLYKDEKTTESEETSAFLSKHEQEKNRIESEKLCLFERDYQHHRSSRRSRRISGRHSLRQSEKKHQELYNDYTRYQYHRRSRRVGSILIIFMILIVQNCITTYLNLLCGC